MVRVTFLSRSVCILPFLSRLCHVILHRSQYSLDNNECFKLLKHPWLPHERRKMHNSYGTNVKREDKNMMSARGIWPEPLYSNLIVLYIDDSRNGTFYYSLISVYRVRLNLVSQHMCVYYCTVCLTFYTFFQ